MQKIFRNFFTVFTLLISWPICAAEIDIVQMQEMPAGNYLCNLLIHGKNQQLNFQVNGENLVCVNAREKGIIGLKGRTQLIGNGVFMTQLQGGDFRATQFWIFNKDGSASIKEIPDRGEKQKATPVQGKTLDKAGSR